MKEPFIFLPECNLNVRSFSVITSCFSKQECTDIIRIGETTNIQKSYVANSDKESFRKSENGWITPEGRTHWVFERLEDAVKESNSIYFKLDLIGFLEDLQYTIYKSDNSFYSGHRDTGNGRNSIRKISTVLMLSDHSEYEGGNFEIFDGREYKKIDLNIGDIVIFPSYEWHRVTPVTKGTRRTLVGWVSGPLLR